MNNTVQIDYSPPLVTVITATWNIFRANRQHALAECIESVHNQDYPNIEHLIIDNASDDGTLDFLSKYEREGWLTCYSEPDDGIYDAMNKGINKAKGKYIAFLNSDDCWHNPTGISRSVKLLESAKADFSYAPRRIINEDGSHMAYEEASLAVLFTRYPFCHQTMFTRTDLLKKLNGFAYKKYKITADYDLLTRLFVSGAKPVFIPHCFTSFRLGGFSSSAEVVYQEYTSILKEYYGKYIDDFNEHEVKQGIVPTYLIEVLRSVFHPSIMSELEMYSTRQGSITFVPNVLHRAHDLKLGEPTVRKYPPSNQQAKNKPSKAQNDYSVSYKFLGLPVMKIEYKDNIKKVRIFGLPLIYFKEKVVNQRTKATTRILGLPLLTSLRNTYTHKLKLFSFLPVYIKKLRPN